MFINWWVEKQNMVYSPMEYYSVTGRSEVPGLATGWVDLKNMLNERRHFPKAIYYSIPFIGNIQNQQIHEDRKQIDGCQAMEGEEMGWLFNRQKISFGSKKIFRDWNSGEGYTTLWTNWMSLMISFILHIFYYNIFFHRETKGTK